MGFINYLLVFVCSMLVCLIIIYAYQRGKHDGILESEKENMQSKPINKAIYIQYGVAQVDLWKIFHKIGLPISEEQHKALIDAFTDCCYSKEKIGFGEGVVYAIGGNNADSVTKPAKNK